MRLTLVGSAVHLPGVSEESARYNLATGYLEAYVRHRLDFVDVRRLELPITLDRPEFAEDAVARILATEPDVLGISSYTWDVDAFKAILPELRRRAPRVKFILGGPTATFDAPNMMAEFPQLDVAVRGEGEETLVELLDGGFERLAEVNGLVYRDGDQLKETPPRPPMPDMVGLQSPYLSGVMSPPKNNLMIECSRGCLFRCKYCAWKNFMGGVRYTPYATVEAEVRWALELGYQHAFILDSAINFDTQRLTTLMDVLRRAVLPAGAMRFSYFLSHLHVNSEQIRALSGVSTHEIYVGLESVQEDALKTVGRPKLDRARFEEVLDQISEIGPATVSIILGIPGDKFDGFRQTVDYLAEVALKGGRKRIRNVRVFWMIIAPGSSLANQKEELGIVTAAKGVPYLLSCASFPEHQMRLAFEFLATHPARSLFLWDDADPAVHFGGLAALSRTGPVYEEDEIPTMGPVYLSLEDLGRLLPMIRPGVRTASGWEVRQLSLREGWPSIRLERGAQHLEIQVHKRSAGRPAFVSTRLFALSWRDSSGTEALSGDATVQQLMLGLAKEIQKREGGL